METGTLLSASIFIAFLVSNVFYQTSNAKANHYNCPPSSCGNIRNISYPFRLKTDPPNCGNLRYNLSCENNNTTTILYMYSAKYYVQSINYNNYTIRLVDSYVRQGNCSSIPRYSLSPSRPIIFVNSENPVKSPLYISTAPCNISRHAFWSSSELPAPKGHSYVLVGSTYNVELKDSFQIEQMAMMPWLEGTDDSNISSNSIHEVKIAHRKLCFPFSSQYKFSLPPVFNSPPKALSSALFISVRISAAKRGFEVSFRITGGLLLDDSDQ